MLRNLVLVAPILALAAVSCKPRNYNASQASSTEPGATVREDGYLLQVFDNGKRAKILLGKELITVGMWRPEGTMGSYNIVPAGVYEGRVCNGFRVSNWDPAAEGSTRDNMVSVSWLAPEGTIRSQCSDSLVKAQGDYAIGQMNPLKAVKPADPTRTAYSILSMSLKGGQWIATISINGRVVRSGGLRPDGTAGGSYTIATEEGDVCGTFRISRWDPSNEGSFRKNQTVGVQWMKPDGSVVQDCAPHYGGVDGDYSGFKHGFVGTYFKSKRQANYLWSLGGNGQSATLKLNGTAVFQGSLQTKQDRSFEIRAPEGFVCGYYSVRPVTSGVYTFSWVAPDGSVARMCADTLAESSGAFAGDASMQGTFVPQR